MDCPDFGPEVIPLKLGVVRTAVSLAGDGMLFGSSETLTGGKFKTCLCI